MNNGKKFDIILMNPPYGAKGNDVIHLKFVDKCLDIANKQIVIYPFTFVTKVTNKVQNKFKERFSKYLISVEEVDSKLFETTRMPNCGIYVFDDKKKEDIKIINYSGDIQKVKSLEDISIFNDYEEEIIKYLENQGSQLTINTGNVDKRKKELVGMSDNECYNYLLNKLINNCLVLKENLANLYNSGIICSRANGGMNGKYFSSQSGQIYNTYNDFEKYFIDKFTSIGYAVILHKSNKAAENCKIALQNSLLRFILYKTQIDQNIYITHYKYVPAINWEDTRCTTDEGLLEMCGCPKDKCKEYAEYCKKIIDEVDRKR